jgi:hypothetical protein
MHYDLGRFADFALLADALTIDSFGERAEG